MKYIYRYISRTGKQGLMKKKTENNSIPYPEIQYPLFYLMITDFKCAILLFMDVNALHTKKHVTGVTHSMPLWVKMKPMWLLVS